MVSGKPFRYGPHGTYIRRCPFLIGHHNTVNDFNTSEPTLLTHCLQFSQNKAVQLYVVDKFLETAALNAIISSELLQSRLSRYDDGDGFGTVSCSMNTNIGNNCGRTVNRLQLDF